MAKESKTTSMQANPSTKPEDRWQTRDDVDTILRHQELREDKKRYTRASSRLKSAARSCEGGRCSSR